MIVKHTIIIGEADSTLEIATKLGACDANSRDWALLLSHQPVAPSDWTTERQVVPDMTSFEVYCPDNAPPPVFLILHRVAFPELLSVARCLKNLLWETKVIATMSPADYEISSPPGEGWMLIKIDNRHRLS